MLDTLNLAILRILESRKYQLQKQIIEAIKANDDDFYTLLKSQWAHRFGVESLDELKNLDLNEENEKPTNKNNHIIDQSHELFDEEEKAISRKEDDIQEKEINNDNKKLIESEKVENKESFKINSYEIIDKEKKSINSINNYKNLPKVEALLPLPPKPKYSYLRKWLLKK